MYVLIFERAHSHKICARMPRDNGSWIAGLCGSGVLRPSAAPQAPEDFIAEGRVRRCAQIILFTTQN